MGYLFSRLLAGVQLLLWGWLRGEFGLVLVRTLRSAVDRGLPPGPLVEALHEGAPAAWRRRWRLLCDALQSGVPLAQAVQAVPRLLPPDAVALIHVGDHLGDVSAGLRRAEEGLVEQTANRLARPGSTLFRLLLWGPMGTVLVYLMIHGMPRLLGVIGNFGVSPPPATALVLRVSDWVVRNLPLLLLGGVLLFWLTYEVLLALLRWPQGLGWAGWPQWVRRLVGSASPPLLLRTIGLAVEAGRPIPEALGWLARWLPGRRESRCLSLVEQDLLEGAPLWPTLQAAGLITPTEQAWFDSAQRAGNLPQTLTLAAREIERRHAERCQLRAELCDAGITLITAAGVLCVMLAVWVPLIQLMEHQSSQ